MLDTSSNKKCGNKLYLICIIILVILIVLCVYYLIKQSCKKRVSIPPPKCNCEKDDFTPSPKKENYIVSSGKVTDLGDGKYISSGNFHTSQELEKDVSVDKNGQLKDFKDDPFVSKDSETKHSPNPIIWDTIERAKNHEILTDKQMQEAAKAYQQSALEGVSLYDRGTTLPKKMILSNEPVPVLKYRGDNKQSVPDFRERSKGNTLVVAREIYEVPYYEFDGPKPKFQKGDKIFTKINSEDKIAMPISTNDTKSSRSQAIADNVYSVNNGKITLKGLNGNEDVSYVRTKPESTSHYSAEMFRIDNHANLVD